MDATTSYTGGQGAVPSAEDYQQYDRIWQRVAPDLNPYPEVRQTNSAAQEAGETTETTANGETEEDLANLPGARINPCCMGSAAMDSLQVLGGFIEEERAGQQFLLKMARRLRNPRAVRVLRQIAGEKKIHIQRLAAAYYLTAGSCYTNAIQVSSPVGDTYCAALRSAYHDAACLGLNYLRSADGTEDLCLQRMFQQMGEAAFRQSDALLNLLSQSIQ